MDTEALRKDKRKLDYAARRRFEHDWGRRRHLWDADHILPVAEGGGECDLGNMRTLCLKCHQDATAALVKRLAARTPP
jgi:5-methylcytosine-specific restriction protein A